jgi:predicted nucleic acid-binding protein
MDRVFLDANVLFSAAYKPNARMLELWKVSAISLWSSRYALEEARVNLLKEDQQGRLLKLAEALTLHEASVRTTSPAIRLPDKDLPILQAAIEARATHLLTGDIHHFGPYLGRTIEGVRILAPADYLRNRR